MGYDLKMSYTNLLYHIVYGTKDRLPLITKELRPDLIVIDLAMPVLNGIVASSVLKQIMPAAPIVMFTAFSDPHIKRMAMAAGLDSFVDKSESPEILLGCIEQLLVQRSDSAA